MPSLADDIKAFLALHLRLHSLSEEERRRYDALRAALGLPPVTR